MNSADIIIQDIDVALKSIDNTDYQFLNIIGNRIMSNLLFFEDKTPYLSGLFIKETSLAILRATLIHDDKEILSLSKKEIESFKELIKKNEMEYIKYWDIYYNFQNKIRNYLQRDEEKEFYKENHEFTTLVVDKLIKIVDINRERLYKEKNLFLNGVINELDRFLNNYGGTLKHHTIYMFFKVVVYQFNYVLTEAVSYKGDFDSDLIKNKIGGYIDGFLDIYKKETDEKIFIQKMSELILKVLIDWRLYFIFYLELYREPLKKEKSELSPEIRKKMGDLVLKALEKEMR